jgi:hydroxymethylglutaryl-CoA synthase
VDGRLSQWAYLSSVDTCYARYKQKHVRLNTTTTAAPITVDHFDYFAFHTPYNKLVQKGFARLFYVDSMDADASTSEEEEVEDKYASVRTFLSMPIGETYESKEVETAYKALSANWYVIIYRFCSFY